MQVELTPRTTSPSIYRSTGLTPVGLPNSEHASGACSSVLPSGAIAALEGKGYFVLPDFLTAAEARALAQDALACESAGLGRVARVGSVALGTHATKENVRRSTLVPLYPPPPTSVGCVETRMHLYDRARALCDILNKAALSFAPAPLERFQIELAYLAYPPGGYYRRHIDVPASRGGWLPRGRSQEDGGSFQQTELRRVVSFLIYLTEGWTEAAGGELRVYTPSDGAGDSNGDSATESYVDVPPLAGSLVCFRSDCVDHEVLTTNRHRQCVVGWLRAMRCHS